MSPEKRKLTEAERLSHDGLATHFFRAVLSVAHEAGGQELRDRVSEVAVNTHEDWPNPDACRLLEQQHPGSMHEILNRTETNQIEAMEAQADQLDSIERSLGRNTIIGSLGRPHRS